MRKSKNVLITALSMCFALSICACQNNDSKKWNAETIHQQLIKLVENTDTVIPEVKDITKFTIAEGLNNTFIIACSTDKTNADQEFVSTLENANWYVKEVNLEYKYKDVSPLEDIQILFEYFEDKKALEIKVSKPVFAEWPTTSISELINQICSNPTETFPAYEKALNVEIDTSYLQESDYFGVYCYTKNANSENVYKEALTTAGWSVSDTKENYYYEATSPNETIMLNFGFDSTYNELQIYALGYNWPKQDVADAVLNLGVFIGGNDTIPSFFAPQYTVNYYDTYKRVAINGIGASSNLVESYKTKIEKLGWTTKSDSEGGYNAVSPNGHFDINFYYEEEKANFNVDVAKHKVVSTAWPTDQIDDLIHNQLHLTGEVLPYEGTFISARTDTEYYPPAILVEVSSVSVAQSGAAAYNQMLLDNGYVLAGSKYGDPAYNMTGKTLAYRAVQLSGAYVTIELFNISELDK